MNKDYTIGIYIRLSMADEDTGSGSKAESDSIGNQRMLINHYLDNHPTLSKYPRLEFADEDVYKRQVSAIRCYAVISAKRFYPQTGSYANRSPAAAKPI